MPYELRFTGFGAFGDVMAMAGPRWHKRSGCTVRFRGRCGVFLHDRARRRSLKGLRCEPAGADGGALTQFPVVQCDPGKSAAPEPRDDDGGNRRGATEEQRTVFGPGDPR